MRLGDLAFFYHSSCKVPGIVGIAKVRSLCLCQLTYTV
jgi:predicted RNA-binding protein with PUA-like domain